MNELPSRANPVGATGATEPVRAARAGGRTITLLPRAPYEAAYVPGTGVVGFAFESQHGDHAFGGDRRRPFRTRPNTLSWVPSGCDVRSRSPVGGEYLTVTSIDVAGAVASRPRWSDRPSPAATRAALALRAGLLEGDLDAGAALAAVEALEGAATATSEADGVAVPREARWLTDARLRRIEEYLDAHVHEPVGVTDLAAACGVSSGFLARICRAATGLTPHAWLLDRRLARARALLATTDVALADVALATGFASHAHLTATMRRRVGVVPSRLRAGRRPGGAGRTVSGAPSRTGT